MSRRFAIAGLIVVVLITPRIAAAGAWSVGAHLGWTRIASGVGGAGASTVAGWPSSTFSYQPGLRLAWGDRRHTRDLILDSGLLAVDEAGSTLSMFVASAGYQHVFRPEWSWSPLLNVDVGIYREDAATRARTSASWGVGAGFRHALRSDHGALRAEVRYDYLKDDPGILRPDLHLLGVRLGFDLWL